MPASYPSSAKAFTSKSDGAGNTILAAHINDLQLEVTAIETDLIAGLPIARGGTGATTAAWSVNTLAFPATQVPSADANTLDDFEESTWTPVLGGSGGTSGQAYNIQLGRYQKVGRRVKVNFYIQLSTLGTITTNAQIQGLPFASANVTNLNSPLAITYWDTLTSTVVFMGGVLAPNSTAATIYLATAAAASLTAAAQANFANTTALAGCIEYDAAN